MDSRWKRRTCITFGCLITELVVTGLSGCRLIFPSLINYHTILWFSHSRVFFVLGGFCPLILAYISGSQAILEILFLWGSGMSALLLRQVLHESKALVFIFIGFFLLLYSVALTSAVTWSGTFLIANFLTILGIVYYQGVKS